MSAMFGADISATSGASVSPKPVGAAVLLIGAAVSPSLVGTAVPLAKQTGLADAKAAPVWCALKYTLVVVAEHELGTVAKSTAAPHARLSAVPAARQSASVPM
jgi:hypothetical protein